MEKIGANEEMGRAYGNRLNSVENDLLSGPIAHLVSMVYESAGPWRQNQSLDQLYTTRFMYKGSLYEKNVVMQYFFLVLILYVPLKYNSPCNYQ